MFVGEIVAVIDYIAAAVAALLMPVAAILFVLGKSEYAARAVVWSIILAFVSVSGYSVVQWLIGGGGGGVANEYMVAGPPKYASKYFPIDITVVPLKEVQVRYNVSVDWGDGSPPDNVSSVAPRPVTISHSYKLPGSYPVCVEVYEYSNGSGGWVLVRYECYGVSVSAPWSEVAGVLHNIAKKTPMPNNPVDFGGWIKWIAAQLFSVFGTVFEVVSDFASKFMADYGIYAGYAFYYYVATPSVGNFPALESVYGAVQRWAIVLLPVALIVNILWRAYWEFERGLVWLDIVREFIWAAFIVFAGLYIYDAVATIVNTVSLSLAQLGQLSALYSILLGFIAATGALGVFSPAAANLASLGAAALIILVIGGVLKWLLTAALVAAIPILAVVWLIPPLRGVASAVASLLGGLVLLTIISAVFVRLMGEFSNSLSMAGPGLETIVFAIAAPIVFMVVGPMLIQVVGGHLGGAFFPSIRYMMRMGLGFTPMVFPSKIAEQAAPAATAAATGGAGAAVAVAGAGAGGAGGGAGAMATSGLGYMAPVVGVAALHNPVAARLMRQKMVPRLVTGPAVVKPLIKEERPPAHPRLRRTYEIMKGAVTGKKPEELSRKEAIAYYTLRYTVGRTLQNLRRTANAFKQAFYRETGIWIPGRLPREQELKKAKEATITAGKWIKEKGVVVVKKFNSGIRAVTNSILERQREIRGEY